MREVRRKTSDQAVIEMLMEAYKKDVKLLWDRAEVQQPQDGFGRLCLYCSDCFEGPCRLNPFGTDEQETICGLDRHELVVRSMISAATDGLAAFAQLAACRGHDAQVISLTKDDRLRCCTDPEETLKLIGRNTATALKSLAADTEGTISVGMGCLSETEPNIVIFGHVPPTFVSELESPEVNLSAVSGSEGLEGLAALTGYESQETVLLTGAVDAIVIGMQDVMPATAKLAKNLNIPMFTADEDPEEIRIAAVKAFQIRKSVYIPPVRAEVKLRTLSDIRKMADDGRKLVYIGGNGHYTHTEDAEVIKLASELANKGYTAVAGGSMGLSLAKANLPEEQLAFIGPDSNAGLFLQSGGECAVFCQVSNHKSFAAALAFGVSDIRTYLDIPAFFADDTTAEILKKLNIYPLIAK